MWKIVTRPILLVSLCSVSLSACSEGELTVEPQPHEDTREFSEAEKAAARALSITNTKEMLKAEDPYAQALLCRHGIAETAKILGKTSSLSGEQEQALRQAEALFDQRLRDLAAVSGKSPDELQEDLEQTAQGNQDRATNVKTAVGCVERLQES